jgi:predicted MPP superfamily phosphohydrolase
LFWGVAAVLIVALAIWTFWGNTALELNTYTIGSDRLPDSFDGYRIAQVSDLHNAQMGESNETLLTMLRNADPDMIAITGDLVDSRKLDMDTALAFIREAVKIAPCYYVTGNHEARLSEYSGLKSQMETAGVTVLEDAATQITVEGASITLLGLQDPSFHGMYKPENIEKLVDDQLTQLHTDGDAFTLMLFHRPSYFEVYAKHDVDLVLAGHMHGGQFRLPFLGGLYTPSHGFFPEYDAGPYTQGNTSMLVSRGIGNSAFPFRFNNRPEVVLIELQRVN